MTRGRGDSGAEVTGAEVSGAEVTRGRGGSGAEVSVNLFSPGICQSESLLHDRARP